MVVLNQINDNLQRIRELTVQAQNGISVLDSDKTYNIQVGANDGQTISIKIEDPAFSARTDEDNPLATLDAALMAVDKQRSALGAVQNRFEDAITNETNLAAARSRIEDADYAVEVANMTRAQILQNVLSLLG